MAPTTPVVTAERLTKRYGSLTAVDGISFDLPPATITGFVGPNGAGKTTTLRMLLGLVRMTGGSARIGATDVGHPRALARVGALIEGPAFYPSLSARRNLSILTTVGGLDPRRVDEVLDTVGLADRAGDRVAGFSLGMKQRLGLAGALLPDPQVMFLDEPTNGLDPAGIRDMRRLLRGLAGQGLTLLVSSHLLAEIDQICDRLLVIRSGQLVFTGEMEELAGRRRTQLRVRPDEPDQQQLLLEKLVANGYQARNDDATGRIEVETTDADAAAVNRLAFSVGVTLAELRAESESLEATVFRMLGEEPA